jgi:aspartyl-tRNA(Asn)/glutamyl-tRNA(Gln) amidotransferase subunit B
MRVLNEQKIEIDQSKVSPPMLRELFDLMDDNVISGKIAKEVFDQMMQSGRSAARVVEEKSLKQLTNPEEISIMVDDVLRENQQVVSEYKNGKQKVFGYLVGQVMKKTRGKANPALVNNTLKEKIKNL